MKAQHLRELHAGTSLLVVPNAWDAGSAAMIQQAGAAAIATTSAGVAWSCGWPDGDRLPASEMLAAVQRMARVVDIPLTVDIEEGCSDDPKTVASFVSALVDAGVAGINIEDADKAPESLVAKLKAIRARLGKRDLYINARTDIYMRGLASGDAAVKEVLRRARLFQDADADGLFVPGIADIEDIRRVASGAAPLPLNVMLVPGLPSHEALREAGARRLSVGISLTLGAYGTAARMAAELLNREPVGVDYDSLNTMLAR